MGEFITAIKDAPVPSLLIFGGFFLLLLAFVSKLGGFIEVQPTQQKWAGPIGLSLLIMGVILSLQSPPSVTDVKASSARQDSNPFLQEVFFVTEGREISLQQNTMVPSGEGKIRLRIDGLSEEESNQLWLYIKGGNDMYYTSRLYDSPNSQETWETRGDNEVRFGRPVVSNVENENDFCTWFEIGVTISAEELDETDRGMNQLIGQPVDGSFQVRREPLDGYQCLN